MYTTEEGIYLLPHIQTNEHIWKRLDQMFPKIDQTSLVDLQLADTDFGTIIIYSNKNRITIPTCVDVNEIELIEKSEFCYEDFPVKFLML